jgi:pimeloyl-ACP methyl ester carboxylesterase
MDRPPELDGVQHRWIDTSRIRMHVAQAGEGEPVLLLHGWPQHWYAWRHVIQPLSTRYRVLCPDLRGLGWSDAPSTGYEKESLAEDVLALLDALAIERVRLVGHDWGAFVGFLLCLRAPERVERFLALNEPHPWMRFGPHEVVQLWRWWYQLVLALPGLGAWALRHGPGFVDAVLSLWSARDVWSDADRAVFSDRLRLPERARASALYYRTLFLRDLPAMASGRYRAQRLRTPTLLLFGADDGALRPRHLRGFEAHADDMRMELVPGVGHFPAEEAPDLVARRALEFLR